MAIEANEQTFEQEVSKSKGIVIVDFWAPWCGPCRMLGPILEEVSKTGKFKIVKVNVDENQSLAGMFGVSSIPTMILFKDGKPVSGRIGVLSAQQITTWAESAVAE